MGLKIGQVAYCSISYILVKTLLLPFRNAKSFKKGLPSLYFVCNFEKRHAGRLRLARGAQQDSKRFAACSAENLTSRFAVLERLISEHSLDAARIWNIDETKASPDKDVSGRSALRRFHRRVSSQDMKIEEFRTTYRVSMMPLGHTESFADMLPQDAFITCREERGSVDSANFWNGPVTSWGSIRDLTVEGRKVLLIYDSYRSHI
eukprot:IDg2497t1